MTANVAWGIEPGAVEMSTQGQQEQAMAEQLPAPARETAGASQATAGCPTDARPHPPGA